MDELISDKDKRLSKTGFIFTEHDACALVASMNKSGKATHGNPNRIIRALSKMGHRCGEVNGEGDGCGILTDIPRQLWADTLEELGKPAWLAEDRRFFVGHLMIPAALKQNAQEIKDTVLEIIAGANSHLLLERLGQTRELALGRLARQHEPIFWQIAGVMENCPLEEVENRLFDLTLDLEKSTPIHVVSLSSHIVIYKVRGSVETLYHYYPELRSPRYMSAITLGHARFSTNTATSFERAQPFSLLGHNGEINTIVRLREQSQMLGVQLVKGGSDSQDLDRVMATLIYKYGFNLTEAMEIIFPPILSEIEKFSPEVRRVYQFYRQALGPFAQGPAAIIARSGDECVFSVDAMGLRPLWFAETEKEYVFSSEKGVLPLETLISDPRPLSPGEKMSMSLYRQDGIRVRDYSAMQQRVHKHAMRRYDAMDQFVPSLEILQDQHPSNMQLPNPAAGGAGEGKSEASTLGAGIKFKGPEYNKNERQRWMAAFGWGRDDRDWVRSLAVSGYDPVGSLGFDGQLAALSDDRKNIADYCKEVVAVVTNPSVDQQREIEHFSTQCVLGPRPSLNPSERSDSRRIILNVPIVLGGHSKNSLLKRDSYQDKAKEMGTLLLDDLFEYFDQESVVRISTVTESQEDVKVGVQRIEKAALEAVLGGASILLLDDEAAFSSNRGWIDPILAVAAVDRILRVQNQPELRRKVSLILRSGAIRNLHDLIMALGLGADAVAPYMLFEVAMDQRDDTNLNEQISRLENTVVALQLGLEKVASTMGIHELRGYGRLFAGIGLSLPIAELLQIVNYAGSTHRGLTWSDLDQEVNERRQDVSDERIPRLDGISHFYPKVWKIAGQVARAEVDRNAYEDHARQAALSSPTSLRHTLSFRSSEKGRSSSNGAVKVSEVDAGLTGHDLPFVIASMSFGSQGEIAFRAYAEAAYRLNMIAMNGEGGEIEDLLGKYPHTRGLQIASGRFGINVDLINCANLLEIKVGQGAKPGEGGHLPGRKVSTKVAAARHTQPGKDLISPSNNHDIYSIEDLAQFIEELKTTNPKARVAVKVPIVPGIGIIALGIVKAGASIVNLSGYDGGTGAARKHSIEHVGLPAEIGVVDVHRSLVEAGLRQDVELWCDGGMRSAEDVVKMMCLGANRVGFGTMAMIAIGCNVCRLCQAGTCHMGIATQIEGLEQAKALGVRKFTPRELEPAVEGLVNLFSALGENVREITADLGFSKTQDLVGRSDLLDQSSYHEQLDLDNLITPTEAIEMDETIFQLMNPGLISLRRPRNHLTTVISNLVMETALAGKEEISFEDDKVTPVDRALGTHLAGALTRYRQHWEWKPGHAGVGGDLESWRQPVNGVNGDGNHVRETNLRFFASSVPGNGLGAYNTSPIHIAVEGGAQDGVAKGMRDGHVVVLKGYNNDGDLVDGSVGKGLAYGATGGMVIVQGDADSRACIRLSGADVIIAGEIRLPLNDNLGFIGTRSNVKGFLCEYMTAGRVLILGDPGPWICAGMTGGRLYLRPQPEFNFTRDAIHRRIAKAAQVILADVEDCDELELQELLSAYAEELRRGHQSQEAEKIHNLQKEWRSFVKIVPSSIQLEQTVSTE